MDAEEILEEGELPDDSEEIYNPLPRPENYASMQPNSRFPIQESESEGEVESPSDSDESDSDAAIKKIKKPKIVAKRKTKETPPNRKKYDIWSTRLQEDVLANTLNNCDVSIKDRSRDVETYDYTLGRKLYEAQRGKTNENRMSNKRSRDDRKNSNLRLTRRSRSRDNDVKGSSRTILDLAVNTENSHEEIAKEIANKLYEDKEDLILRAVNIIGKEKAIKLFEETKHIELDGGMLIMNQTRRRTPGGVFLFLLRHDGDLTHEQSKQIFSEERMKAKDVIKKKQKQKNMKLKGQIALSRQDALPELLSKAELCVQKLADGNNRDRKESDHGDVINPPPTPETDGHENSGDGMDNIRILNKNDSLHPNTRRVLNYDEDYLDLRSGNDMDLL